MQKVLAEFGMKGYLLCVPQIFNTKSTDYAYSYNQKDHTESC